MKRVVTVIAGIVPEHGSKKFVFENIITFQTY